MITRRTFLQRASATCAITTLPAGKLAQAARSQVTMEDPLLWVDPRIGTGGHGHCFPAAAIPFGAVRLSRGSPSPASAQASLILDLPHGYAPGAGSIDPAELRQPPPDTLAGGHRTSA